MIDYESKRLYEDASSSLIDAFSKFLKFVKYEDEIADGLTGIAYIFFYHKNIKNTPGSITSEMN